MISLTWAEQLFPVTSKTRSSLNNDKAKSFKVILESESFCGKHPRLEIRRNITARVLDLKGGVEREVVVILGYIIFNFFYIFPRNIMPQLKTCIRKTWPTEKYMFLF